MKGYRISDFILGIVGYLILGGTALDKGLKNLFGTEKFPAPNNIGKILRKFKCKSSKRVQN